MHCKKTWLLYCFIFISPACFAFDFPFNGHIKFQQYSVITHDDSLNAFLDEQDSSQQSLDFRLRLDKQINNWRFVGHYQLTAIYGNYLELQNKLQNTLPSFTSNENSQWFNLGHTLTEAGNSFWQHKLDRAYIAYNRNQLSIKFGRQVLSWGNGLVFKPMDLFNPFPPNAIDTSYKPGIDMLYSQWLFNNGSDLSAIIVPRRNPDTGKLDSAFSSSAIKWHIFGSSLQTDFMLARDYKDTVIGLGINGSINDALWRFDLVPTFTENTGTFTSLVLNLDTAWLWQQKNINGFVEYYRNGFGLKQTAYSLNQLPGELSQRLTRGQLFTSGRDYLSLGLRAQWTALLQLSPLMIFNLNDHSRLFFLQGDYSLSQNLEINFGATLTMGSKGSEFSGIETSPSSGIYFATGKQFFARLSYYF